MCSPTAPFIRDQWYVAAQSHEIDAGPLGRTICGERLVLFRRASGAAAALEDICSHRKYPLSRGRVVGEELQCLYHGARFNHDGVCTGIPGQENVPRGFDLQRFPLHEAHRVISVWIGDPAKADPALIPDWSLNSAPDWTSLHGRHVFGANYQLVLDNLLDLTHITFVHKMLRGPGLTENPLEFEVEGEIVHTRRMMRDVELPGIFAAMGKTGKVDRWQKQRVEAPSYVYFETGAEPAGSNKPMLDPHHVVIQGITPETAGSTHYFWSVARRFALDDQAVSDAFRRIIRDAFDEDAAVLEAQQRSIENDRKGRKLGAFVSDAAGLAVRRILAGRLAATP